MANGFRCVVGATFGFRTTGDAFDQQIGIHVELHGDIDRLPDFFQQLFERIGLYQITRITIENKTSIFRTNDEKILALDLSVLYIGVDNFITVASSEINKDDLVVTVSQGSITGDNGKYYIRVHAISDAVILKVSSKNGKELGKQVFKVRTIPDYPAG